MKSVQRLRGVFIGIWLLSIPLLALAQTPPHSAEIHNSNKITLHVSVDASEAPDLGPWLQQAKDLCEVWYPRIVKLLASPGFVPPDHVTLRFRNMDGVAYTAGDVITISADYVRHHPDDLGMVIHELTHVVQSYPSSNAGWLVEGIADYVRFFFYEPKAPRPYINIEKATYHDAYRTTAAFLAWATSKYDKHLVQQLNQALREGKFDISLFQKYTGRDVDTLWNEFIADIKAGKARRFVSNSPSQ
ncbi:basic secretory protein-like protein [Chthonomonas calidirosea]|uniref:basic secretory protein-like protein n=1 Tax=Chthonomonas calidirosea TaxID=454171 RepID=UPI0009489CF5|nr:basic secretory protein-like protein [Chthonomonas calidirosea]